MLYLIRFVFAVLWLCSLSASVRATPEIKYVYDGDTVKIQDGDNTYKLRITDIDAPERNQQYGKKAKRALVKLCKNTDITVQPTGIDKYQRTLGYLSCDGISVSEFMVTEGYAWFNTRYSNNVYLQHIEAEARSAQRGLWKQKRPMPPWIWRQKHPHN